MKISLFIGPSCGKENAARGRAPIGRKVVFRHSNRCCEGVLRCEAEERVDLVRWPTSIHFVFRSYSPPPALHSSRSGVVVARRLVHSDGVIAHLKLSISVKTQERRNSARRRRAHDDNGSTKRVGLGVRHCARIRAARDCACNQPSASFSRYFSRAAALGTRGSYTAHRFTLAPSRAGLGRATVSLPALYRGYGSILSYRCSSRIKQTVGNT